MKRTVLTVTGIPSSEELSDSKMSTNEIELWVRFEDETDEQAHLVPVNKTGFVAHLQRAVAEKLNIDEMTIKSIVLNNTVLSTRTKLDSLDCSNGTFVICRKDSKSEEKVPTTPEVEDQDDGALFEDTRKISTQVLFDFPSGEDSIDIPYRCIDHKSIQVLRMPLSTTLAELKAIIAKQEGVEVAPNENDKLEVDLHVWSHPLVYHKRTENLSLARLGFRELLSKQDDDDENAFDNRIIYVVFRTIGSLTQKQEWAQFDMSPSWAPCRHRQSPIGMMQFLSALYVLTHSLESDQNEANHFLGHLCYLTRFPPAILAFYYLMKNKKIYAEQKAALSNTLYYLFRQLVPRQSCPDDSKLFENALKCFGYLLTEGHQEYSIDTSKFEVITLTCPLTFSVLTDPVRVKSSKRNRVYNRKSLVDRMPGGSMFMEGTPFANLTMDMLIPDTKTKLLLLSHPLNDEILVLNSVKENQILFPPRVELSIGEWTKLSAKVTVTAKILHITPPLALRTAAAPALTRDEKGQICVYTGPEPCSVGTVILHNTVTLQNKRVRPDDLAKALGHRGESVDDREVLEAIMVCLDTSGSMDDFSFAKDDNEDEKIRIELTMEEAERELKIFHSSDCLSIYKRLYRMDPAGVMEEIASQGMLMQNLVESFGNRLVRILLDPFQVVMMDVRIWPEQSNYLQWLPDSILQVIYHFVLELPDISEKSDKKEPYQLPPPKNPISISIRSLKGTSWNFDVDKTFTVLQIKRALEPMNDRPSLRLIYNGKVLEDEKMLGFYGIKDQDLIIVIWSVAAKKPLKDEASSDDDSEKSALEISSEEQEDLVIVTERDYQEHTIHIDSNRSLEYLRLQLWEELGLKPSEHSLWQGFQDVDGWGERAYVDENGIVESLFESSEKVYYGPRDRKKADPRLTRLETVKQLFHAFINRSQAYDYPNHIGLILFNNTIRQACALTPLFEVFRDHIDKAYANGGTNLYGAVAKAAEILSSFKITHPKAHLRIVCFTDGEDTLKTIDPEMCAKMMRANGVILDAIMIGEGKDNHILRAMAKSTGGYAFAPQTLTEALNINELETMLSVSERPIFEIDAQFNQVVDLVEYAQLEKYPLNVCNREVVPSRKMPEELSKPVVSLENAVEQATQSIVMDVDEEVTLEQNQNTNNQSEAPATAILEKQRTRRILKELRFLLKEPHPNFDIYPNSSNIGFWQIVMEVDPEGSHYSGGTWLLYAEFPPDYPSRAPEIRFVTPIRHSNVNQYGKICHSIFTRNWTADTNMQTVFNCIYGLMLNPDTDDPLDTNLALSFFSATGDYEAKIMTHVEKYAKQKDRDAWRKEFELTNDPKL